MNRMLNVCVVALLMLSGCDDVPAPPQYDHAMLREYFGKAPAQVEDTFGKPSFNTHADSQLPPEDATPEEQEQFNQTTERMTYVYSTVDGDLTFHFNLKDVVHAITYLGKRVSPPHIPIPSAAKLPSS